jgi:hypothetical protein
MPKQRKHEKVSLIRKIASWCLPLVFGKVDYDKETKLILKDKELTSLLEQGSIQRDALYDYIYDKIRREYQGKTNKILLYSARAMDMDKLSSVVTGIVEAFMPGAGLTAGIEDLIELGVKTAYIIPYWAVKRDTANTVKLFSAEVASCYPAAGEGIDIFNLYVNQLKETIRDEVKAKIKGKYIPKQEL